FLISSLLCFLFIFSSYAPHLVLHSFPTRRSSDLSGDSSKKFKIAEGQWYRYAPSYVSPAYHLLEGFPFIQEPPSGDKQEKHTKADRKSGSAGMPRPISYAVFCLKKKTKTHTLRSF